MWKTGKLTDKSEILAYLETDRLYAAYAIGDLEPGMFEQTTWAKAEETGQLQALVMLFRGLNPPVLFLMGGTDSLRAILEEGLFPQRVYLICRPEQLLMTHDFYLWEETVPMWRMVLKPSSFRPVKGDCVRLEHVHYDQLVELYTLYRISAFSPAQLQQGIFYGVLVRGQVVSAAGTHLISPAYSVAAVGNILTHPDYRELGYGTAATSAVVAELLQRGIRDIILNVGQDNAGAIRIYERLGFQRYCTFFEGPASTRNTR
jgi:GNAT superfamily N-acetyltransferase